ncbi:MULTISPECIES: DUF4429 domain-containing protein [Streptosporangiaceae]|uniref:DUF4429 domain-containing protein n=1 Tax=Streptosporangiaceae TaxID=2004 RepID=UPI0033EE1DCB
MRANGYLGGYVEFDGQFVTIGHGGATRLLAGSGVKRIHFSQVSAVQIKPAGRLVNGFIQFAVSGSPELRSRVGRQTYDAGTDENSVVFTRKHQSEFEALARAIEQAKASMYPPQPQQPDAAGQLAALWQLVMQGAMTRDEFERQKAQILGAPPAPPHQEWR